MVGSGRSADMVGRNIDGWIRAMLVLQTEQLRTFCGNCLLFRRCESAVERFRERARRYQSASLRFGAANSQ
jgi:hypothetical protein